MEKHAYLSPSAAHRWLNCTASVEMCKNIKDEGSVYAAEGTLAHAIAEAKLLAFLHGTDPMAEYQKANGKDWTEEPLFHPEMEDCTDGYRDTVIRIYEDAQKTTPDAKMNIEQRVIISDKLYGTADAVIVADGLLNVIDYKHGKGVEVSAEYNPQMMIYALAACHWYAAEYDIGEVTMTIVQPRISNFSSWSIKISDLLAWEEETLLPAMRSILEDKDTQQKSGSWCKFCKVKATCRKLSDLATQTSKRNHRLLSLDEIAQLLPDVPTIKAWCEEVTDYALQEALKGNKISGFKVVEGRSKRVVRDGMALAEELKTAGYDESLIWKPRELETLTTLEKLVGKKKFGQDFGQYIDKPRGKPTLAPESDKRPAWCENELENDYSDIIHNS